jgi:dihydroflavonol-4-reductase
VGYRVDLTDQVERQTLILNQCCSFAPRKTFIELIGRVLGQRANRVVGRGFVLRGAGHVSEWISMITGQEPRITRESAAMVCGSTLCQCAKARRELDYRPGPLETMFRDCIDWMIAEKLID